MRIVIVEDERIVRALELDLDTRRMFYSVDACTGDIRLAAGTLTTRDACLARRYIGISMRRWSGTLA